MTGEIPNNTGDQAGMNRLVTLATVVYALQAVNLLFPVIPVGLIVAVVIDYVKLPDAAGTWIESHYRWQIRTFWTALGLAVLGVATYLIIIGYLILLATWAWVIYRVVKGWLYLSERKPLD